jgi:DNA-binding response OmpR family regulator
MAMAARRDRRVLVVDDERFFREAIREALAQGGVECELAASGEEGLKAAEDPGIAAVVLDVRLPGIDGVEALRQLRARRPTLRVIVLSAHTDQELVLEALRLGACDYLAKPIHEEELRLAVGRALEGYAVESRWESLRGRLQRLAGRLAEVRAEPSAALVEDRTAAAAAPALAEALAEVLAAGRTSVLLRDEGGALLHVLAATGSDGVSDLSPAPVEGSLAGLALAEGGPLRIDDVDSDPRCAGLARRGSYRTASALLAPVPTENGPVGVLCATEREGGLPFEDEDLALLRILTLEAGPLLAPPVVPPPAESADPREVERVDLAREICDAITSEIEPERTLDAALSAIARGLDARPVSIHLSDGASGELLLERQWDRGGETDHERLPRDRGLTGLVLQTGSLVATDHPEDDPRFDAEIDTPRGGAVGPMLCLPLRMRGKVLGVARIFPDEVTGASARTGEVLAAALSAAMRSVLLYRSLLESIDDVARARREGQPTA